MGVERKEDRERFEEIAERLIRTALPDEDLQWLFDRLKEAWLQLEVVDYEEYSKLQLEVTELEEELSKSRSAQESATSWFAILAGFCSFLYQLVWLAIALLTLLLLWDVWVSFGGPVFEAPNYVSPEHVRRVLWVC